MNPPRGVVVGELVMLYRKDADCKMVLHTCGCGTKTPRRGGVCSPCERLAKQLAARRVEARLVAQDAQEYEP